MTSQECRLAVTCPGEKNPDATVDGEEALGGFRGMLGPDLDLPRNVDVGHRRRGELARERGVRVLIREVPGGPQVRVEQDLGNGAPFPSGLDRRP
ncbi:hypothetical protein [Streptosporangium roseum]|uniref:hypothetical protein n=1 Tax=Streptosporangium roseum TaxID=2001 RepID=UPI0031F19AB4